MKIIMYDIIRRAIPWALLWSICFYCLSVQVTIQNARTAAMQSMLLVLMLVCVVVFSSNLVLYSYTPHTFTDNDQISNPNIGYIYLGNSILAGFVYLSVYFTKF